MIFVDTSALYAFLDRDADAHERVAHALVEIFASRRALTHNYVIVETAALAHRRLGTVPVRRLLENVAPALKVEWVGADLHGAAVEAYVGGLRRRSSLVDHVSFEVMRRRGVRSALALDRDFAREGFELVPLDG